MRGARRIARLALCACAALIALGACSKARAPATLQRASKPDATASLAGRVLFAGDPDALSRGVVFLKDVDAERARNATSVKLEHVNGRLVPSFSAVERGGELTIVNRDAIYHSAFSLSRPNGFSFRAYAPGTRVGLRLSEPGVIRIYCRIHEGEAATLFVAPGPLARPSHDGHFAFREVPAGRFLLGAWAEGAAGVSREITLRAGERAQQDVLLVPARGE